MTQEEFLKLGINDLEKLKFVLDSFGNVAIRGMGAKGDNGKTLLSGTIDPTTEGVNGDFYLNTTTITLFGPKTAGTWGTGVLIKGTDGTDGNDGTPGLDGTDGNTLLSGTIDPTTEGVNGDFYLNTITLNLFGPKTGGVWGTGVFLKGTDGTDGNDGVDINWLGVYNAGTGYIINDAVSYNGSSYICKLASTGNLPTNTTYFDLMAQKGIDGVGSGDVVGPASSTDNNIAVFDGITGKLIKDGGKGISNLANSFTTSHITASVNPAVPFTTYLVNASAGNVTITLPNATNNTDEYRIVLEADTHNVTVTTVGGTQLIGGKASQIISTVGGGIYIKSSTNHYDIISDTRNLQRIVDVTTNIDLSTAGYENGTTYHIIPSGGTITVTLPDSSSVIEGTTVRFTLHGTGDCIIKTASLELIEGLQEQNINENGAIRIVNDGNHYYIDTDTRPKVQNSAVNLYSLSENSAISDGGAGYYKQSSTSTTDARYSGTSTIITTGVIGTDTYIFGGISDEGVIQGILPEGPADTIVNIARDTGSASFRFYIKFYKYSAGVETLLGTSSLSNVIDTSTIASYTVRTNLVETSFLSTDRIIRKVFATSAGSPTAKISVEGASPSFSTISAPATSISHNSLAGIQQAGNGITNGHISDGTQIIAGIKTFSSFPETPSSNPTTDYQVANKKYVDNLVNGLLDYRGAYDASSNIFPTSGGSGIGGVILKGDMFIISVAGILGGTQVQVGDSIIANIDYPINSLTNWDILNSNLTYVPEDIANKATTMAGNTTSNIIYLSAKAIYDWATGLFAQLSGANFTGAISATNLSGTNTGDQDLSGLTLKSTTITINGDTQDLDGNLNFTIAGGGASFNGINGQSISIAGEIVAGKIAELTAFASGTFNEIQISTLTRTTGTTTVTIKKNGTAVGTATITSATSVTNLRYFGTSIDLADTFVANDVIIIEVTDTGNPVGTNLVVNIK